MLPKFLLREKPLNRIFHDETDFLKTFESLGIKNVGPLNI
jgi:hypothetical protein